MVKKRLIFTLLYDEGNFMLSRNFRLQRVGDFKWINRFYNFSKIAYSIDELIILDISRNRGEKKLFTKTIQEIIKNVFIPISVGGGIKDISDVDLFLNSGADKVVLNSLLFYNPNIIKSLIKKYGSQCIVASIDHFKHDVYIDNGSKKIDIKLYEFIEYVQKLGVGEIYLNSIEKDGTGQGYDIDFLKKFLKKINTPIIIAGGAGNSDHFVEALKNYEIDAVATANLFNFLGDSLPNARKKIIDFNIPIAKF